MEPTAIPTLTLKDGTPIPRLGQGTWHMGDDPSRRREEIQTLQAGIAAGMTLIDTAEMYGEGLAESLVGEAIAPYSRQTLFLVSKVYPHNAGRGRIFRSCENSLRRLGTSYLDLYLLHWRGSVPLAETVECMEELRRQGMIRRWGVSNLDREDLEELWGVPHGDQCQVNQVLYHLGSRGIEFDLLPWQRPRQVATMAYCPLAQGGALRRGMFKHPAVTQLARQRGATPAQILLAFVLRDPTVVAIPKASTLAHMEENAGAAAIALTPQEVKILDEAFPPPTRKTPLDIV